jgi:transposase-like protein
MSAVDHVYVWADGIHLNVRLGTEGKLCLLVMIRVRPDGTKQLIALAEGYRESPLCQGRVGHAVEREI